MKWLNFNTLINIALIAMIAFFVGRYIYFLPKYSDGTPAPDFSATLKGGESFTLSSLKGNFVLLDFWASWCGPCRRENPDLVQLYKKYNDTNFAGSAHFHIVGIGVERSAERWKNAIRQDSLYWPYHMLDQTNSLKFFDGTIADLYGIKQIPTKYLLDENMQIALVDPSIAEIDRWLAARQQ